MLLYEHIYQELTLFQRIFAQLQLAIEINKGRALLLIRQHPGYLETKKL